MRMEFSGAVSQYLNGVIALNVDAALKFSRALKCAVADFSPRLADQLREGSEHAVEVAPGSHRLPIRRARFKLSAGITGYEIDYDHDEGEPIFMALRWFREKRYRPERLLAIRVSGRSMEPSLYDGDLVIVNTDDVALTDGEVFAANYEGELVVKRLKRQAGAWLLASDNPDKARFPDKLCSDGCGLIGRIVYKQSEHI